MAEAKTCGAEKEKGLTALWQTGPYSFIIRNCQGISARISVKPFAISTLYFVTVPLCTQLFRFKGE
jgi:hypothetical protein